MPEFTSDNAKYDQLSERYDRLYSEFQILKASFERANYKIDSLTAVSDEIRSRLQGVHFLLQDIRNTKAKVEALGLTNLENQLSSDLQKDNGLKKGEAEFLKKRKRLPSIPERNLDTAINDVLRYSEKLRHRLEDVISEGFKVVEQRLEEVNILVYQFRVEFERISGVIKGARTDLRARVPDDDLVQEALDAMLLATEREEKEKAKLSRVEEN